MARPLKNKLFYGFLIVILAIYALKQVALSSVADSKNLHRIRLLKFRVRILILLESGLIFVIFFFSKLKQDLYSKDNII